MLCSLQCFDTLTLKVKRLLNGRLVMVINNGHLVIVINR